MPCRRTLPQRETWPPMAGPFARGPQRAEQSSRQAEGGKEGSMFPFGPVAVFVGIAVVLLVSGLRILAEYERGVILRLGRLVAYRGPGPIYVLPLVERMVRVDLRTITMDIPPQDVITRDNVSVKINAVLYFRVLDPNRATVEVANYLVATSQLAQTTLRSICGQAHLDELLAERDKINAQLQEILDAQTDPWGVKVSLVEVKHIDLAPEMQRVLARQAEAERERRAKVINAEGEFQAAQRLAEAAQVIQRHPAALQLRYLQTLATIARSNPSTTLFPVPIDLMTPFVGADTTRQ
jgi:regulator of protease activity HflC (stomatin/prohibitin superfamily)